MHQSFSYFARASCSKVLDVGLGFGVVKVLHLGFKFQGTKILGLVFRAHITIVPRILKSVFMAF